MNDRKKKFRELKVLETIIQGYILKAKPISSRYVSRKLGLSSATIRNIMSDLEEIALIDHPHTSAGRIPTDGGYRFYVDSVMRLKKVTEKQIKQIELEYRSKVKSLDDILEKTAHILSRFTNCAGVTFLPKTGQRLFKHINLTSLSKRRILISLVAESDFIKDYIIEVEYPLEKALLDNVSDFLNSELYNMALEDIRGYLVRKLRLERDSSYNLVKTTYDIIKAILKEGLRRKLYFDGASHILAYPEFKDQNKLRSALKFFEEKEALFNILSKDLYEDGLKVHIGSENRAFGFREFSIITAGFKASDQNIGRLGVVGPTRMDYEKAIPIVDFLASTVTKILSYQE